MRSIGIPELFLIWPLLWLLPALLSGIIANRRGGSYPLWLIAGFASGPFAWLTCVMAYRMNNRHPCPFCRERVDQAATICPHCRSLQPRSGE